MNAAIEGFKLLPIRLGITSISLVWRWLLAGAVVIAYMTISRIAFNIDTRSFAQVELLRAPARLIAALFFWLLMADVIFARAPNSGLLRAPAPLLGIGIVLATPALTGDMTLSMIDGAILAVTAVTAGLSEELFFRGILQNSLIGRFGAGRGIAITAACFVVYHIGATAPDALNLTLIFLAGLVFCLVYYKTNSMLAVVPLHSMDDALVTWPGERPFPLEAAVLFLFIAIFILARWVKRAETHSPLTPSAP